MIELRQKCSRIKDGILAHVSDAPSSFPPVSIDENDEQLVVCGQSGRLIGAGYWLDNVLDELNKTPFWEQSNKAVNLEMSTPANGCTKDGKKLVFSIDFIIFDRLTKKYKI